MKTFASSALDEHDPNPIYDVFGVAVLLGVHPRTVLKWVAEGRLPCAQIAPRTRRFTMAHIQYFLSTSTPEVPKPRKTRRARAS